MLFKKQKREAFEFVLKKIENKRSKVIPLSEQLQTID